ncbi:MAG: type II toxin-antitoxin system VapC family toxin [Turneriella sp.]|nr:type II toxin-antitoxin system VapC family toxin [Turneriella sp.]
MVLLDTCTLLWLVQDYRQLPPKVQTTLDKKQGAIYVSAISAFEIGVKYQKKKLSLPLKPADWFQEALEFHGLTELPLTAKILFAATALPPHHTDPADRILIATAAFHKLVLLTPDDEIRKYSGVKTIW